MYSCMSDNFTINIIRTMCSCDAGEWMVAVNKDQTKSGSSAESSDVTKPVTDETDATREVVEPKGDPEMAPVYLKRLMPVFTQVYQRTMIVSVRCV